MILLRGSPEGDTKCSPEGVFSGGLLRGSPEGVTKGSPEGDTKRSHEGGLLRGSPEGVS